MMRRFSNGRFDILRGGSRQRAGVFLLVVVALTAGCSGLVGDEGVDDSAPLDDIPAEADGLVHVQTAILSDSVTESTIDGLAEMEPAEEGTAGQEPESWDEAVREFENETDLGIDDVHSATMFAGGTLEDGEDYTGVIVKSNLSWEEIEEAADAENATDEVEEDSYNDVTVYVEEDEFSDFDTWVADFGDGTFAIGPEPVVKDVIDTRQGDASGIDDDLRNTYEDATEGYLTAAFTLTDEQADTAGDIASEEAGIGEMFVPQTEAVTMSYHTEDDQVNAEVDIVMQSTEDAETFTSFVEPVVDPPSAEENPDAGEQPFEWLIDRASIDSTDERVSLAFRADPDELLAALEAFDESGPFGNDQVGTEFMTQPGTAVASD